MLPTTHGASAACLTDHLLNVSLITHEGIQPSPEPESDQYGLGWLVLHIMLQKVQWTHNQGTYILTSKPPSKFGHL